MDDLEFEISATKTGQRRRSLMRRPPRAVTVGLVVACALLVTTGLALASVPGLPSRVNVLLRGTPTATPRIPPGGNLLYIEGSLPLPWSQFHVNGEQAALDPYRTGDATSPITLRRGVTTIDYRADPFPVLRCHISVPARTSDTCPLDARYPFPSVPAGLQNYSPRALDLTPTLDQLPSTAKVDLVKAVRAELTVQSRPTTVQPGERYVNGEHQIVYANRPLTATFTQMLATGASPTSNGCSVLCMPAPDDATPRAAVADFVVDAHVTQRFAYSTASGQPVVTDAPISANSAVPSDAVESLAVTWNGSWQITQVGSRTQPFSALCLAGAQALQPYIYDARSQVQVYPIAAEIPAANPADGCLYRLGSGAYVGSPTAGSYLHLLYRFGGIMIVNDIHDISWAEGDYQLNKLPLTDAAETALAQRVDASQPYS